MKHTFILQLSSCFKKVRLIKKALISIFICCFFTNPSHAQLTYRMGMGLGVSPYSDYEIVRTFSGDIGYSFYEELSFFGGINLFSQKSNLFKFENDDTKWEEDETTDLTSFIMQTGVHYSLTLKTFTKNKSQWEYKRIGLFPEINGYFNPHVNRRYKTKNGEKYKAPYANQWAYGLGGGVFYGSWKYYLALKYECNTIDNIESLSKLIPDMHKNRKYNHVVSLMFVFR